jgi:hypothetical protein
MLKDRSFNSVTNALTYMLQSRNRPVGMLMEENNEMHGSLRRLEICSRISTVAKSF